MKQRHEQSEAPAPATSSEDDSIDLAGAWRSFLHFVNHVNMDAVVLTAFLLFCLAMVLIIRVLPLSLPVTDDWAAQSVTQSLSNQVTARIDQEYPSLPPDNKNTLVTSQVNQFIAGEQSQYQQAVQGASAEFKSQMRYTGDDGQQYTFLGDIDSYFWLRYARNIVRHGNTCDSIVDGQCRDDYILAPVGGEGNFNPSIHVFAIFAAYVVINFFHHGYPLPAASYDVTVLLGVLAVIPAFFVGRRLAGNVGGLFAAVLISINPLVLSRTLGSNKDIWNVILPLFMMWMAIEALEAKSKKSIVIFGSLAALFNALHYAAWDSAWFIYLIVLFAMVAYVAVCVAKELLHGKKEFWKSLAVQNALLVTVVFYVASLIFILILPTSTSLGHYIQTPILALSAQSNIQNAIVSDYWPNVLTTVAELNPATIGDAINYMGGAWFFFLSLVGLMLLVLPRKKWHWEHYVLLFVGCSISLFLVENTGVGEFTALALIALPIAIMIVLNVYRNENVDMAAALIVLVWFMATLYATYSGVRFILFMVYAFGVGFAVLAGRIYELLSVYSAKEVKWHPYITNVVVFVLIALLLIQPIRAGVQTARAYVPDIDSTWWNGLTQINQESSPDAIINSWWDFGHWYKYVADRRVTDDGTTQPTHVSLWLGLSLVSPSEKVSAGVLRMLDCGSDAFPNVEGWDGADGYALNMTNDSIKAQQLVRDLVGMNKSQAQQYLAMQGFSPDEQRVMLNRTDCDPPEDYFITSGDLVSKSGVWAHFGLWNFTDAYVAEHSISLPRATAEADLEQRFNMSPDTAEKIYYDAKALTDQSALNQFGAPTPSYITPNWMPCTNVSRTIYVCPLGIQVGSQGAASSVIDSFTYNASSPNMSTLNFGIYENGVRVDTGGDAEPAALDLAFANRTQYILFPDSTSQGLGVLYDVPNHQVLLADPLLLNSTFTQLFYLNGRYSHYFQKFYDATDYAGLRVIIWKVNWNGTADNPVNESAVLNETQ